MSKTWTGPFQFTWWNCISATAVVPSAELELSSRIDEDDEATSLEEELVPLQLSETVIVPLFVAFVEPPVVVIV